MVVLVLVFVLLAVWFILGVVLWAWTLWFQGYIYNEPAGELHWRAPAAAAAVTVLLIFWCFLAARNLGGDGTVFDFSPRESKQFDKFVCIKGHAVPLTGEPAPGDIPLTKDIVLKGAREVPYALRRSAQRGQQYVEAGPNGRTWTHADADGIAAQIRVKEDDKDVTFQADLIIEQEKNKQGEMVKKVHFKPNKITTWLGTEAEQPGRYVEVGGKGRVMTEDQIGQLNTVSWGLFGINLLLNLLHLAVWFVCLWLLMRFQWSHALGLAIVFWLVMTLIIVPMVLARTPHVQPAEKGSAVTSLIPDRAVGVLVEGRASGSELA
jgi:hypothetical protein